jgi:hypothetical protein
MRQLRTLAFLFSLFAANYLYATPIHFNVNGIIAAYASNGVSPIVHGTKVTGWYELDWDKAKFGTILPNGAIYTGILTYQFKIGNNLTLSGSNPNIEYHSTSINISPNSDYMQFQDQSPDLFNVGNFLPIEDLFFYVSNTNGVHKARFDYYSVPDFNHDNNVYSGWCDLAEAHVPEPSSLTIFMLGFISIFLMRAKRKI